jgi:hypothetical protein
MARIHIGISMPIPVIVAENNTGAAPVPTG